MAGISTLRLADNLHQEAKTMQTHGEGSPSLVLRNYQGRKLDFWLEQMKGGDLVKGMSFLVSCPLVHTTSKVLPRNQS